MVGNIDRGRVASVAMTVLALALVSLWVAAVRDPQSSFPLSLLTPLVGSALVYGYGEYRAARKARRRYAVIRGLVFGVGMVVALAAWFVTISALTPIVSPYAPSIRGLLPMLLSIGAIAVPALAMWGRTVEEQRRTLGLTLIVYAFGALIFGGLAAAEPDMTIILVAAALLLIAVLAYPPRVSVAQST